MAVKFDLQENVDCFRDPVHRAWLDTQREELLDFYQPNVCRAEGGYSWLGNSGEPISDRGAQLWLGARMIHVFSLASMQGRPGAAEVVEHGLDFYVGGRGHDQIYGGWFPVVGGISPADRKELYGIAQMLLAGCSATTAGFSRGPAVMEEALTIIDKYFWLEEWGRCAESFDRKFTSMDEYRGQNANMHLAEAYLAAHQVTKDPEHLRRATSIAWHIAGRATQTDQPGAWRLPEHFDTEWNDLLDYNIDDPRHPFRPYGSQIGHWLEWSKLCLQIRAQGVVSEWLLEAAKALFRGATTEGWAESGGFFYTVDWSGNPIVRERFFWEPAEALGAARQLWLATGDQQYQDWYRKVWEYVDQYFIDSERGGWFSELDDDNGPTCLTWDGKPDMYHVYQATMYAFVPADQGLATWAMGLK